MDQIKKNFIRLIYKIKNFKEINKKMYKGKIFRYNTKGMYLLPKLNIKISEIKQFFQRGINGYSYVDRYSIRDWFLTNIVNLLHDMQLDLHGSPYDISYEEWQSILKRMEECFRQANEDTCDEQYSDDYAFQKRMLDEGLSLFVNYFYDLWD